MITRAAIQRKVTRAWRDRTLPVKLARYATNLAYVPVASLSSASRLTRLDRQRDLEPGFRDHRGSARELVCSDVALERIAAAFRAAENDQRRLRPELAVRGVWAEWLDLHYGRLRALLRTGDLDQLRALLENLHREPMSTGVGGTRDDIGVTPRLVTSAYYRNLWAGNRAVLCARWPDLVERISTPLAGNPHGVQVDGRLLSADTFRHAYYAQEIRERLGALRAVAVLEIGAGLGGLAHQLLMLSPDLIAAYTIVDLPEVASLSAYMLMATLGEDSVRLFGEPESESGAPVSILPASAIVDVATHSIDVVFNAYSFSEMDSNTSSWYVREIERICRDRFLHLNHETRFRYRNDDGTISFNAIGSEVLPCHDLFELVAKDPAAFVRLENRKNRAYFYEYRRRPGTGAEKATAEGC